MCWGSCKLMKEIRMKMCFHEGERLFTILFCAIPDEYWLISTITCWGKLEH